MRIAWLAVLAACGGSGEPVNVAGNYSVNVTNGDNGCQIMDWAEGETTTSIPLTIMQDGNDITADVGGVPRLFLDAGLGTHVFVGDVDGSIITMEIQGTKMFEEAPCTWTINANAQAHATGDLLAGDIVYTLATNGDPACGVKNDCENTQEFNGARPPQ